MQNAEIQLDAAHFFLDKLQDSLKEPRAVYHYTAALLNAVYAVGTALEAEVGKQRYKNWIKTWSKDLTKEDQLLVEEILRLRGKGVHEAGGISLHPSGIRFTHGFEHPTMITLRKQGASFVFDHTILATGTGLFEDITRVPLPTEEILTPGSLIMDVEGDSPSQSQSLPAWQFADSTLRDTPSACQQVVGLSGRFLQEFRTVQI